MEANVETGYEDEDIKSLSLYTYGFRHVSTEDDTEGPDAAQKKAQRLRDSFWPIHQRALGEGPIVAETGLPLWPSFKDGANNRPPASSQKQTDHFCDPIIFCVQGLTRIYVAAIDCIRSCKFWDEDAGHWQVFREKIAAAKRVTIRNRIVDQRDDSFLRGVIVFLVHQVSG